MSSASTERHRIERDLLIRKLFTGGLNTAADAATSLSVTVGLLKRIWTARMDQAAPEAPATEETQVGPSLAKESFVLAPAAVRPDLGALADRCAEAA